MSSRTPRPVSKGSRLAIVAPAGPFDHDAFRHGVSWLRERYDITHSPEIFSTKGYFAGSDQRRLNELNAAIADPTVDAILCARGGYGTTRILPGIDPDQVEEANKLIVGFSDITALHTLWASRGVRSIHAPMVAALGGASEPIRQLWIEALEQPGAPREWNLSTLKPDSGNSEGTLIGGNLAVLAALNGTPYTPNLAEKILFIEDVGERPYRVDRMLTTLKQSGWFEQLRGLVLGAFTEGDPGSDGVTVENVFESHFRDADFPILKDLPAGHIRENEPLSFGSPARISGNKLELNY
ncbi:MAG: LD-carboxypeptidase [Verrucomicrobiales bacterium]|nr:LD-carboxypeptidase [Verrucomicrobiales bacterium]